jgi:hypothetical protein
MRTPGELPICNCSIDSEYQKSTDQKWKYGDYPRCTLLVPGNRNGSVFSPLDGPKGDTNGNRQSADFESGNYPDTGGVHTSVIWQTNLKTRSRCWIL